jgi:lipopolysaccharide export system permease protein
VDLLHVKDAEAATLPATPQALRQAARQAAARRETTQRDTARRDTTRRAGVRGDTARPVVVPRTADRFVPSRKAIAPAPLGGGVARGAPSASSPDSQVYKARVAEAKLRLEIAQRARNRYEIEIHKKFSLAAACVIFVIVGAPIAVRFPRGGVGLVIGVSLLVFALYYVGLIGGEALANDGLIPPFWAMWGTNVILTVVGVIMFLRMGRDSTSNRGGDWSDKLDALLAKFGRGPQARLESAS